MYRRRVIVRDAGDAWQVVLQTDHADVSAALARAWADRGERHESVVRAARRHDDGWAVWERSPLVHAGNGRPVSFLDVQVPVHLAFYRAAIAAVTDEDPYAGLLVSMHGAGIYRQRYGRDPGLLLSHAAAVAAEVEAFVTEQQDAYAERLAVTGAGEEERWADYDRLQAYDRLSLAFCLHDLERGEQASVGDFRLQPVAPWQLSVDPYPFVDDPVRVTLLRYLVPKEPGSEQALRAVLARPPQRVVVQLCRD